jgi:hypothetical protein
MITAFSNSNIAHYIYGPKTFGRDFPSLEGSNKQYSITTARLSQQAFKLA